MGLDLSGLFAESRIGTDVAGGGPGRSTTVNPRTGRIDAVGWDQGLNPRQIDGREAQAGAPTRSMSDDASNPVRAAQEPRSFLYMPVAQATGG